MGKTEKTLLSTEKPYTQPWATYVRTGRETPWPEAEYLGRFGTLDTALSLISYKASGRADGYEYKVVNWNTEEVVAGCYRPDMGFRKLKEDAHRVLKAAKDGGAKK